MHWSGLILAGILITLLACSLAGIAVVLRRAHYRRVVAAVQANNYPASEGYKRLCTYTERMTLFITCIVYFLSVAGSLFALIYANPSSLLETAMITGGIVSIFLAPCLVLPGLLYDLLGIIFVDIQALAKFQGSTLEQKEGFILGLKSNLFGPLANERRFKWFPHPSLFMLFLLEILGLLLMFNLTFWLWLIPLLVILWGLCYLFFGKQIIGWLTSTCPIEQSPWASLIIHISEWARVTGVKFQDIRTQHMIRIGTGNSILGGFLRPTLLLNTLHLTNSDWRQQEALVASMLGQVRKRVHLLSIGIGNSASVIAWTSLAVLSALLFCIDWVFLIALSTLTAGISIAIGSAFFVQRWLQRRYIEADHIAAELTNDPIAMIVALNTTRLLATTSRSNSLFIKKRIDALYQLIHRSVNREPPWENAPVAAIEPFTIGDMHTLTVPLQIPEKAEMETEGLSPASNKIIALHKYRASKEETNTAEATDSETTQPIDGNDSPNFHSQG